MTYFDRDVFAETPRPAHAGAAIRSIGRRAAPVILDTQIDRVRRDRDFGRVEARIGFLVKEPHRPVRLVRISTNVPARGAVPLRERLEEDARILLQARRPILGAQCRAA